MVGEVQRNVNIVALENAEKCVVVVFFRLFLQVSTFGTPSGTEPGTELFALHFLQVNTCGAKGNQVEPRPEPICLPFLA